MIRTLREIEIDLKELLQLFVRKLKWIIPTSIVGFAVAYFITIYLIAPKYTSSISLYVNNNDVSGSGGLNINDINASQKLVNTYIVILQDDEVLDQLAERLHAEYSTGQLSDMIGETALDDNNVLKAEALRNIISMSAVNNTEVLKIETETENAVLSARICTIMVEIAPDVLTRVVKAGSVEVIGAARVADGPSSPSVLRNSTIGFIAGMALSMLIVLLRYLFDNTIKDEEDLKKHYNIPVLGEIPDFNS